MLWQDDTVMLKDYAVPPSQANKQEIHRPAEMVSPVVTTPTDGEFATSPTKGDVLGGLNSPTVSDVSGQHSTAESEPTTQESGAKP